MSKNVTFRFLRRSILIKMFKNVKVRIPVEGHHALRLATVSFVKQQSSLPFARLVPSFSATQLSLSQASYIISLLVSLSRSILPRALRLSSCCRSRSPSPASTTCVSVGRSVWSLLSSMFALSQLGIALCYGRTASQGAATVPCQCRAVWIVSFPAVHPRLNSSAGIPAVRTGSRWHAIGGKMGKTASKLKSRRSQSQCEFSYAICHVVPCGPPFAYSSFVSRVRCPFDRKYQPGGEPVISRGDSRFCVTRCVFAAG